MHVSRFKINAVIALSFLFPNLASANSIAEKFGKIEAQVHQDIKYVPANTLSRRIEIVTLAKERAVKLEKESLNDDDKISVAGFEEILEIILNGIKTKKECSYIKSRIQLEYGSRTEEVTSPIFFTSGIKILADVCPTN